MTSKTLEEICNILPRSKRNTKYGNDVGKYPFFTCSKVINRFVDIPDYDGESLIIGDRGEPNISFANEFSASDICYILQNKNKSILNLKYVYYYLHNNLDIMDNLYTGETIKHISKANVKSIAIPIPSLEQQNAFVEYCEMNDEHIKQLEKEIECKKAHIRQYIRDSKIT